jgi:hypothetical protein
MTTPDAEGPQAVGPPDDHGHVELLATDSFVMRADLTPVLVALGAVIVSLVALVLSIIAIVD